MRKKPLFKIITAIMFMLISLSSFAFFCTFSNYKVYALKPKGEVAEEEITAEIDPFISELEVPELVEPLTESKQFLLIGADDNQGHGYGRADSMILCTIDAEHKEIKLSSFLRDNYITIPQYGQYKLNAAHSFGGPDLTIETINQNFGTNIQNYIKVDFKKFTEIVDIVDGVDIHLTEKEAKQVFGKADFRKFQKDETKKQEILPDENLVDGVYHLNGEQALTFSRIRKIDSDFSRSNRQRIVLESIYEKIRNYSFADKLKIATAMSKVIETNIPKTDLIYFLKQFLEINDFTLHQMYVPSEGTYRFSRSSQGAFIIVLDIEKNSQLLHNFIHSSQKEAS